MRFIVPGDPVPKSRPRFTRYGRTYTPAKTVKYEKLVAECYRKAGGKKLDGAVYVKALLFKAIPASWSRSKRMGAINGQLYNTSRFDIDNACKSILDGLNAGVAYDDDSQVVSIQAFKGYKEQGYAEVIIGECMEYNISNGKQYARYSNYQGFMSSWMDEAEYKKWLKVYRGIASINLPTADTLNLETLQQRIREGTI